MRVALHVLIASLSTLSCVAMLACRESAPPRPNVLLYVVDSLRADALGAYGDPAAKSPHFDALGGEGMVFDNAYANASWTRASMATLLTGLLPWHHATETREDRLPETARTLAEVFREHGYATALISANPNVSAAFGFRQAFDHLGELLARPRLDAPPKLEAKTPSDVVAKEAAAWMRTAGRPFLLVVLPIDPHFPYQPPQRHAPPEQDIGNLAELLQSQEGVELFKKRARAMYQGEVAFADESFGALVDALQEADVWDHTIAVVTADHGEEFWEYDGAGHGKTLTEAVLRVPLIVRHPHDPRVRAGTRVSRRLSLVDLAPTLLDLAGIPIPDGIDGISFFAARPDPAPVLAGLDLDGNHLFASIEPPYKLVWNVRSDERHLYDLRRPSPEATAVDPQASTEAARAAERLAHALDESLAAKTRRLEKTPVGELPEDVEASLRALGHLD